MGVTQERVIHPDTSQKPVSHQRALPSPDWAEREELS